MPAITATQLTRILPNNPRAADWVAPLNAAMAEFAISANRQRIAAFIAQLAHESAELTRLRESLKYTTAQGICNTWPDRFPTVADAQPYVSTRGVQDGRDELLANRVYGGRLGNGPIASGDGWRYRGRGLIQVTGRHNYEEAGAALGVDLVASPDRLLEPLLAARSAGWFWKTRGLNGLADDFSNDDDVADFIQISVIINGGRKGLAERQRLWGVAKGVLGI